MNMLISLIIIGFIVFLVSKLIGVIFKKFSILSSSTNNWSSLKNILAWMLKNSEIKKRLFITGGILIVLWILYRIPLPGINLSVLKTVTNTNVFSFSRMTSKTTIFSLGLLPFFSSCLWLQFGSIFIPPLRKVSFDGESGRKKLLKYTYIFAIIISLLYSCGLSFWLESMIDSLGKSLVTHPGWGFRIVSMFTMTAGVMLLLFIAEIITDYGIGNGVVIVFISSFPLHILSNISKIFTGIQMENVFGLIAVLIVLIFFIYITFFVTTRAKSLILQHENAKQSFIYLKPTIIGTQPLGWTQNLLLIIFTLSHIQPLQNLSTMIGVYAIGTIFIFIFTYLYALIVFNPNNICNLVNRYGYSLNKGENDIKREMRKVLIATFLLLIGVYLIPALIIKIFCISSSVKILLSVSGILIAVGVFLDIINQLEFFKKRNESGIKDWAVCYTALDEIEAEVKTNYLRNKEILSFIEPLRFTWGMPIRTIVDQYRIYVPINKKNVARGLILEKEQERECPSI